MTLQKMGHYPKKWGHGPIGPFLKGQKETPGSGSWTFAHGFHGLQVGHGFSLILYRKHRIKGTNPQLSKADLLTFWFSILVHF